MHMGASSSADVDYERLAAELLRGLRGKRSQVAFARRLGYRSNVAHNWEHGRSWPTAARTLWIARRLGVDVESVLRGFYRLPPWWLESTDVAEPRGMALWLKDLKGNDSAAAVAEAMGVSRFTITRWLSAKTEPKLPEFLRYLEVTSLRLMDFVALLVDPVRLPSIRNAWEALQRARSLAYTQPWSQAVLRALETRDYRSQLHDAARLAARLGVDASEVESSLEQLHQAGQVRWNGSHWEIVEVRALDTGRDRKAAAGLRAWWGRVGAERAQRGVPGMTYNVVGVSRRDLVRLRELQKAYVSDVRSIVAQSEPVERVVLAADLIIDLGDEAQELE